mmetsp:Transcript_41362/g.101918  ORF Transcript_41362/g.101918 Transcript_41362/m.101918 type:complete len:250 (+) Transcript_41362:145-894(+)
MRAYCDDDDGVILRRSNSDGKGAFLVGLCLKVRYGALASHLLAALHGCLELPLARLVLGAHGLGLGAHPVDLLGGQPPAVVLQLHLGVGASLAVARRHGEQTVGVHLEHHVDLGLALLGALHARDLELPQQVVVVAVAALALEDAHVDLLLVVVHGGELGLLLARHRGVAGHNLGKHLALALHTQRQGDDVHQQQVGGVGVTHAGQNRSLHRRAVRHSLVGVHGLAQLLAVEVVNQDLLHAGDARGAAH